MIDKIPILDIDTGKLIEQYSSPKYREIWREVERWVKSVQEDILYEKEDCERRGFKGPMFIPRVSTDFLQEQLIEAGYPTLAKRLEYVTKSAFLNIIYEYGKTPKHIKDLIYNNQKKYRYRITRR